MANTTTRDVRIDKTNGNGFLTPEMGWLNISKYAKHEDVQMPSVGARVRLTLDGSNFVRRIETIGEPTAQPEPEPTASPEPRTERFTAPADTKDLRITRLACLNTATNIIAGNHGRANADEVIALAERLEGWVIR